MWPGSQALRNGGTGGSVLQRASGSIGRGLRDSGAWGQSWPGPESGSCVGQSCAQRVPRGHPGEARGQQKEAGAQSGLARNAGGLQAHTQGRLVPALMWGCHPQYLDQSYVSLIQNWDQEVPGNKTRAVSAGRKPQNKAAPLLSPPSRGFKALWAFSDSCLCSRSIKHAAIGQACGRARSQVVGPPSPPGVCSLGVSGWGRAGSGGSQDLTPVLAAPVLLRRGGVHPVAGGGRAHPTVRQPQGHPPEGGRLVRGLLLAWGRSPGSSAGAGRAAPPTARPDQQPLLPSC